MRHPYQLPKTILTEAQIKAFRDAALAASGHLEVARLSMEKFSKAYIKSVRKDIRRFYILNFFKKIENFFKGVK